MDNQETVHSKVPVQQANDLQITKYLLGAGWGHLKENGKSSKNYYLMPLPICSYLRTGGGLDSH
jgi:hypothetical protein